MPSFEINPNAKKGSERDKKLQNRADAGGVEGRTAAKMLQKKGKGPSLPGRTQDMKKVSEEEVVPGIKLVDVILGEEKCGKGMYYCYTDKKCKKMPEGLKMTARFGGGGHDPQEVGIDKPVEGGDGNGGNGGGTTESVSIEDAFGNKFMEVVDLIKPEDIVEKCWTGYTQKGLKKKGKKMVPNCVPVGEENKLTDDALEKAAAATQKRHKEQGYKVHSTDSMKDVQDRIKKRSQKEEVNVDEAVRLQAEYGNLLAVVVIWRGRSLMIKMFFPQATMPKREDVQREVQKVYPGCKVTQFRRTELPSETSPHNDPILRVQKEEACPKCAGKCGKGCECDCHKVDEEAGEKDACYHKVKARYSVWPSAYASGALVKCRKKGAKNWGNKTKKEEFEYELNEGWVANTAAKAFVEEGLNEEGVAILIEEMGLESFVEFVYDLGESTMLSEARAGGVRVEPVTKGGKAVGSLKGGPKAAAIKRLRKEKQARRDAESGGSKPSGMKAALRSQSDRAKAVKSAKSQQPKKRGLLDKVAKTVLDGMDRHNKAMKKAKGDIETTKKAAKKAGKVAKDFGSGFVSGVKTAGKAAKAGYKMATEEEDRLGK
jgi:hypothetical protein